MQHDIFPPILITAKPVTCFDCIRSTICGATLDSMAGPGEPEMAECEHPLYQERQADDGEDAAETCPGFIARMVEVCAQCKATIHQPAYRWGQWAGNPFGDPLPVCSEKHASLLESTLTDEALNYP